MEAGEREMRQAFEEVTTKNVRTNIEFSQQTRKIVREHQENISRLENLIVMQKQQTDALREQVSNLQQRLYISGSTPLATVLQVESMINEKLE